MLILTRRPSESVLIGDNVTVTFLGLKNGAIRIGVSAPKSIPVHREEVYARIRAESEVAEKKAPALVPSAA